MYAYSNLFVLLILMYYVCLCISHQTSFPPNVDPTKRRSHQTSIPPNVDPTNRRSQQSSFPPNVDPTKRRPTNRRPTKHRSHQMSGSRKDDVYLIKNVPFQPVWFFSPIQIDWNFALNIRNTDKMKLIYYF